MKAQKIINTFIHHGLCRSRSRIQSLIETPAEVDRAAAHQAKLEKILLAAGGITGPGTLGAALEVAEVNA